MCMCECVCGSQGDIDRGTKDIEGLKQTKKLNSNLQPEPNRAWQGEGAKEGRVGREGCGTRKQERDVRKAGTHEEDERRR